MNDRVNDMKMQIFFSPEVRGIIDCKTQTTFNVKVTQEIRNELMAFVGVVSEFFVHEFNNDIVGCFSKKKERKNKTKLASSRTLSRAGNDKKK